MRVGLFGGIFLALVEAYTIAHAATTPFAKHGMPHFVGAGQSQTLEGKGSQDLQVLCAERCGGYRPGAQLKAEGRARAKAEAEASEVYGSVWPRDREREKAAWISVAAALSGGKAPSSRGRTQVGAERRAVA